MKQYHRVLHVTQFSRHHWCSLDTAILWLLMAAVFLCDGELLLILFGTCCTNEEDQTC